ncbi:Mu transposase-like protein [Rhizobium sp. PP-CC-2G-626]|nr:Mu transposase-like protein [Rhizobium sp. PP-CC-2G-626]
MKEWLTAREIAEHALPDLPASERGVQLFADRSSWNSYPHLARMRSGRGGGYEYHLKLLPSLAQLAYAKRHLVVGDPKLVPQAEPAPSSMTDSAAKERDARLAVIAAYELFAKGSRFNQQACLRLFCDKYEMGSIMIEPWVKEIIPNVSTRSLFRWKSVKAKGAKDALAVDRSKARKGKGLLETANGGAVRAFILAWVATNPALAADEIFGYIEDEFGEELVDAAGELKPMPSLRMLQHFIKALKVSEKVILTAINNPDKYRSHHKLRGTGSYSWIVKPNELWMIDASPADAMLTDGRHSIYVCIDVATRWLTVTVSKTPRASAVGLLMRKAVLQSGVCTKVKTDNGSDFVAQETQRLFHNLDIDAERSAAFTPEEKAFVERAIKTVQHKFFSQLPGYIGHNVAERKAIEDRKSFALRLGKTELESFEASVTAADLQVMIDDWLEHVYHQKKHGGLFGLTPAQAMAQSAEVIRRVDVRALDMLLMPAPSQNGRRTMTAQGVSIGGDYYLCGSILPGTEVFVRLDPEDMGKIYLYSLDGHEFLDEAICPKFSNINRPAFVKAKKEEFNQMVAERTRAVKKDVRALQKNGSGIERTLRRAKAATEKRNQETANVIQMPRREEPLVTPELIAAIEAMDRPRTPPARPLSEKAAELHAAIVRESEIKAATNVVSLDPDAKLSPNARMFKWALSLEEIVAKGNTVSDAEAIRLVNFQASSTYQTMRDIMKDFGLDAALRM